MKNTINKYIKNALLIGFLSFSLIACEKDEGEEGELDIHFKTEAGYTHADATIASGSEVKIGIEAETEKAKDPIIRFNISESTNGEADTTVYMENLEDTDFSYDHTFTLNDSVSGNTHLYTFTVTNRDGINAQKSLIITVK